MSLEREWRLEKECGGFLDCLGFVDVIVFFLNFDGSFFPISFLDFDHGFKFLVNSQNLRRRRREFKRESENLKERVKVMGLGGRSQR